MFRLSLSGAITGCSAHRQAIAAMAQGALAATVSQARRSATFCATAAWNR